MQTKRIKIVGATLAMAMVFAAAAQAQNVLFNGAGSSAAFTTFALGARISSGGTSGTCGTHNWTKKSSAQAIDSRSPSITPQTGNVWIVWDDTPEPNRKVCAYLQLDSIVGARMFFAVPRATLSIPSSDIGTAGDQIIPEPLFPADEVLPSNVYNDINNKAFNAAPSDIRPEDDKFATTRALTAFDGAHYNGLGYGPGPIGTSILSAFSTKSVQVVDFSITGTDPITGMTVPAYTTTNVGAQAIIVAVNTNDTASGGLGTSTFNNINRFVLGKMWDGTLTRTRDISNATGLPSIGIHVLNREPLSGTFNTFEFTGPRSVEINTTQEVNCNPGAGCNPMNLAAASGGTRQRVIGTGEMVAEIGAVTDSIGYAFWSTGNFAGVVGTTKYLQVDGVDPLFASYSGGFFPTCAPPCPGIVSFTHIIDGTYPMWNVLRVITDSRIPSGVSALITASQAETANVPDYLAISSLNVFRSHYTQAGRPGANGHKTGTKESGGDMGGAVFTVQSDTDNITDTGKELIGFKQ